MYQAAPNNSLISFAFFLLRGTKKISLSSNIQTDDFSLNLVPKVFSLAFHQMPALCQMQWQRRHKQLHYPDVEQIWCWCVAAFYCISRADIFDELPCCWPVSQGVINFHSISLLLSSHYYPVMVTVNNLDKFILVACEFSKYSKGCIFQSWGFRKLSS